MTDRDPTQRIALVTGGNRGLGLETCRQLHTLGFTVVLSARDKKLAKSAADDLGVDHLRLDLSRGDSIARAAQQLKDQYGRLDVLVNNAGVSLDGFDATVAEKTLAINVFAPMALFDACHPFLSSDASVVMVSSGMGSLSCLADVLRQQFADPKLSRIRLAELLRRFVKDVEEDKSDERGWPRSAYRVSKAGLNAATRVLARELAGSNIMVNAVCPGWVQTEMGGPGAPRPIEDGAKSIVWAAALPPGGPSGGFFRDGQPVDW